MNIYLQRASKEPTTSMFAFPGEQTAEMLTMTAENQRLIHNTTPMRILYPIRKRTDRR